MVGGEGARLSAVLWWNLKWIHRIVVFSNDEKNPIRKDISHIFYFCNWISSTKGHHPLGSVLYLTSLMRWFTPLWICLEGWPSSFILINIVIIMTVYDLRCCSYHTLRPRCCAFAMEWNVLIGWGVDGLVGKIRPTIVTITQGDISHIEYSKNML